MKMRFLIILALVILVLVAGCDKKVHFADMNLEMAIREAIGKYEGPILKSDIAGWKKSNVIGREVVYLNGIEHGTSLEWLNLKDNKITDISPLSNLPNLHWLDLRYNKITDITPLSTLTNLRVLQLERNPISDISPLSNLTNLQYLNLWNIPISDISPLSDLTNLQTLKLSFTQITDISILHNLKELRELYLDNNRITSISTLELLTKIGEMETGSGGWGREGVGVHLGLSNNQIEDISPLVRNSGIGKSDGIDLRGNPLNDEAHNIHIPALIERGVNVLFDPKAEGWE